MLFTAVYLPTFRLIINATLKVPCGAVLIKSYEGLLTAGNLWRDLFYFFCQGIRNQTRPLVSVSNHLSSDSCCLIMVCEDSRPNPLRHPHILLWGSHSPGPGGEEFFQGNWCKTPSLSPSCHWGKDFIARGCEGVLDEKARSGSWVAEGFYWDVGRFPLISWEKHGHTHCSRGSEESVSRLAVV